MRRINSEYTTNVLRNLSKDGLAKKKYLTPVASHVGQLLHMLPQKKNADFKRYFLKNADFKGDKTQKIRGRYDFS